MSAHSISRVKKGQNSHEILIFDIDDTFHLGSPRAGPTGPSSTKPEPSTSHPGWDICTARLGPAPSRSPTPDVDVVHPPPPRETTLLETRPGFFLSNNTYVAHWECCQCHKVHPITDKNKKWRSRKAMLLTRPREAVMYYSEKCTKLDCIGTRCDMCFDLDLVGYRRQHCNNAPCEFKKTPLWLQVSVDVSNLLMPYDDDAKCSDLGGAGVQSEEYPATPKQAFPLRPW